jgi:hypothetical protein
MPLHAPTSPGSKSSRPMRLKNCAIRSCSKPVTQKDQASKRNKDSGNAATRPSSHPQHACFPNRNQKTSLAKQHQRFNSEILDQFYFLKPPDADVHAMQHTRERNSITRLRATFAKGHFVEKSEKIAKSEIATTSCDLQPASPPAYSLNEEQTAPG